MTGRMRRAAKRDQGAGFRSLYRRPILRGLAGRLWRRRHPHRGTRRQRRPLYRAGRRGRIGRDVQDRKRVVEGKRGSVRVDLGGRRVIKKKKQKNSVYTK